MGKKNFYAVKVGRCVDIYTTWDECSAQVHGFPSADFKGFATRREAETFMGGLCSQGGSAAAATSSDEEDIAAMIALEEI
eukprot:1119123-Rhodomonas_salina.1